MRLREEMSIVFDNYAQNRAFFHRGWRNGAVLWSFCQISWNFFNIDYNDDDDEYSIFFFIISWSREKSHDFVKFLQRIQRKCAFLWNVCWKSAKNFNFLMFLPKTINRWPTTITENQQKIPISWSFCNKSWTAYRLLTTDHRLLTTVNRLPINIANLSEISKNFQERTVEHNRWYSDDILKFIQRKVIEE